MTKNLLSFLIIVFLVFTGMQSTAQLLLKPVKNNIKRCYTVENINDFKALHPNAETDAEFEAWLNKKMIDGNQNARPLANYTIKVIFHIIHNGESVNTDPNLDAALINAQILQLNKDFANASNSPYAVAANTGIQFVLAKNDVFGSELPEPGIERIDRNDLAWTDYSNGWTTSYINQTVKPASTWDASRYFNIWVVPAINNDATSEILGYATFPAGSTLPGLSNSETINTAGVVITTGTVGSTFFSSVCGRYNLGRTLTHEVGHFLGLRHIWGDANCGNDFCNDTPIHFEANGGTPTHPKSNSCGTIDEMFENYMDYSDDVVSNTFTTNQVDRMQTVMLNSPRRLSLHTSNVGSVAASGSNKISFTNCTGGITISEAGANTNYPRFRDISLTLNVEDKATGAATVTISATGTALVNIQYQLLTPIVTFATGDNFKAVNLRIFDNALADGDRTIVLSYNIAGFGVSAGFNAQNFTITIQDDDNMRVGENTINLLNESFENPIGSRGLPTGWRSLATTGYPNTFVASVNGSAGGSGLCAHITNNTTSKPNTYTKGVEGAAVLQSPTIDLSAVQSVGSLSFKYRIWGLLDNDFAYVTYNTSDAQTGPFYFYGSTGGDLGFGPYSGSTEALSNAPVISAPTNFRSRRINLSFYWDTGIETNGSNPGFNVDDIVLQATPYKVETTVSNSYTYDVVSGAGINNFKSTNNKAIATITNLSQNVSALTAQVTESGIGLIPINTQSGFNSRTQKVIRIFPTTANTTATYRATLYFTSAELAVWGSEKLNLKILKVKDGVLLNSALNASNAEIVTPTVVENVADGFITYTANFTGFSQFMLVSPLTILPVGLVSFQATAIEKNIQLQWSTSLESNNRGFFVDRSLDGTSFKQIGWVNGNGNTNVGANYRFTDNFAQRNITYYYRLRQVDTDGKQTYSLIRNARLKSGNGIVVTISPNPVKDIARLFISGTNHRASIEIINAAGQQLLKQNTVIIGNNGLYQLPMNGFAKGVYTVIIQLPEGIFTQKVIVQ